jgi:hypothetical protein
VTVEDTGLGAANRLHISPWSAWQGMAGSVLQEGLNVFRLQRNVDSVLDTYTGNALVYMLEIQWISDAPTDD